VQLKNKAAARGLGFLALVLYVPPSLQSLVVQELDQQLGQPGTFCFEMLASQGVTMLRALSHYMASCSTGVQQQLLAGASSAALHK
jgi:hypothetical protein